MAVLEITTAVERAATDDAERLVATLTRAFETDDVVRWVYPDDRQYLTSWPELMRLYAAGALAHGTADRADGFAGVALWLPPGVGPDEAALVALVERSVPAETQAEVFDMFAEMEAAHPHEPHWYLPFIGVDPLHQGKGAGSALLRHALARCDRDGLPAYLEATSPHNRRLYERHGFEVIGTIRVGPSLRMWPMRRAPR
jgi:ribosomal protein S18 acetylase RimI-like enzyme